MFPASMAHSRKTYLIGLVLISIAALGARLEPYVRNGATFDPDSSRYVELAKGLVSGCGFARRIDDSCASPEVLRTPGYPLFLATTRYIGVSIALVSIYGAIVVFCTGFVLARRWSYKAGLVAATLLAADLSSICRSSTVLTDSFFQLVIAAGLLCEVSGIWRKSPRLSLFLAGSLILSLSPLVRPIGIFLWPVMWAPIFWISTLHRRTRVIVAIFTAMLALLPSLVWSARNLFVTGDFTFSTEGPVTAYYFVGGGVLATAYRTGIWDQINELEKRLQVKDLLDTPASLNGSMIGRAAIIAAEHPIATLEFELFSGLRLLVAPDEAALRGWLRINPTSHAGEPYFMHFSARLRDILSHPGLLIGMSAQLCWLAFTWTGIAWLSLFLVACWKDTPMQVCAGLGIIAASALILLVLSAGSAASSGRMRVSFAPIISMLAGMGWYQPEPVEPSDDGNQRS